MNKWVEIIVVAVLMITVFLVAQNNYTYYHEAVHEQIYGSYNISSYVDIDFISGAGWTYADKECPNEQCDTLHNWNEIFSYNLAGFAFHLWSMLIFYIIWKTWKDGKKDKKEKEKEKKKLKKKKKKLKKKKNG